jgi:hypothetical protein
MFTVQYVKNLKWCDAEHSVFECIVKYEEFGEEHPTGVNGNNSYAHIQEIWVKGNAGEYGEIAEYVVPPPLVEYVPPPPPEPTNAELMAQIQELAAKIEAME